MEPIKMIIEHATNPLTITLPDEFKDKTLEITISVIEAEETGKKKYDFSKFFGKLKWEGDALADQRKLRDEWD